MMPLLQLLGLALLIMLSADPVFAQKFEWAKRAGGTGLDEPYGLSVDAAGNSYVVGTFTDSAYFGNFTVTPTFLLDAFSTEAVFIAKYNAEGQEVWARKLSDSNLDFGKDIAVDATGTIYVTGGFSGTAQFGNTTLVSNGFGDMFLAKYDTNGNFIWAQKGGGASFTIGNSLALDSTGNCYVTGYFRASAVFGDITLTSMGRDDVFIIKYDTNGNVEWAKSAGGVGGSATGIDIAVTTNGACYVTGTFNGSTIFDSHTLPGSNNQVSKPGLFLAKFKDPGNAEWVKQVINPAEDSPGGIITDTAGNCYIMGSFTGTAKIGPHSLTSKGAEDVFIAKYDPTGQELWAKSAGGTGTDLGKDIAVHQNKSIYLTGIFTSTAAFADTALTSKGAFDVFITHLSLAGQTNYALRAGGAAQDNVTKIALDTAGNAYITGYFNQLAFFDVFNLTSKGDQDLFVAKFGLPFFVPTTITIGALNNFNYCAGPQMYVPFQTTGNFNPENTFVVQLSDAFGSFSAPVTVGTGPKGPILVTIPATTPLGNGYKIRVVASSPSVYSNISESSLTITPVGLAAPIPNIITPNGDGLNDNFRLSFGCLTLNLQVYNRWGNLLYEQANYQNNWNGGTLPAGLYYYQVQGSSGQRWKGWVEIIR